MIEVINRQRRLPINNPRWRSFSEQALRALTIPDQQATIVFVSDRTMRELNRRWRGKSSTTDVLSFPSGQDQFEANAGPVLGDVVISVEQAKRQAREHGLSFNLEVSQLILHGLLHLSGYDHETDDGEMNRLELRLRRKLDIDG